MKINYSKLLNVILNEIIPETYLNVKKGNKLFGAAIIKKTDLSTICIGVNNEIVNPLFHGEISTINNFFTLNFKINPKECIFLTTHEPCSLCLSAITWAGFNTFYYFFPYEDTKTKFSIPHDLKILEQVFKISEGQYNYNNEYWHSYSILKEISKSLNYRDILTDKIQKIFIEYDKLSLIYQKSKNENNIPLN